MIGNDVNNVEIMFVFSAPITPKLIAPIITNKLVIVLMLFFIFVPLFFCLTNDFCFFHFTLFSFLLFLILFFLPFYFFVLLFLILLNICHNYHFIVFYHLTSTLLKQFCVFFARRFYLRILKAPRSL